MRALGLGVRRPEPRALSLCGGAAGGGFDPGGQPLRGVYPRVVFAHSNHVPNQRLVCRHPPASVDRLQFNDVHVAPSQPRFNGANLEVPRDFILSRTESGCMNGAMGIRGVHTVAIRGTLRQPQLKPALPLTRHASP